MAKNLITAKNELVRTEILMRLFDKLQYNLSNILKYITMR